MRGSLFWLSLLCFLSFSASLPAQSGQPSLAQASGGSPVSLGEAIERVKKNYPPSIPVFELIADEVDLIAADLIKSEQALSEAQLLLETQSVTLQRLKSELTLQESLLTQVSQEREAYRQAYEDQKIATIVAIGVGVGAVTFLLLAPK